MTQEDFEKEIEKITKIIAEKYHPDKIILFGSMVWGRPHKYSDADLFIVKHSGKKRHQRTGDVYDLLWKNYDYSLPIDVIVYTPEELQRRMAIGDFFIQDIVNYGKLLYEKKRLH